MSIGFVGIGHMGQAMARNLLRAGVGLRMWSRTREHGESLTAEGAVLASSIDELFEHVSIALLMLRGESAVDIALLREVLDAGPMASDVSRGKLGKMVLGDHAAQAAIVDVAHIADLVAEQAGRAGAYAPLMDCSAGLFHATEAAGNGHLDMAAVRLAFSARNAPREATPQ